jgi:gluconokinase
VVIIMMGAAGAGKTTVGTALAAELGWPFVDADDHHPPHNVEKMRAGVPLTDADRAPWIASLAQRVARAIERREPAVLACSALKEGYRRALRDDLRGVRFVYLAASEAILTARLAHRRGHFMPASLVASQLADLEQPADALTIDATLAPDEIIARVRDEFGV